MTVPTDIGPGLHEFTATAVNNGVESGLSNAVSFTISCAPTIDAHGDDTDCTDGITISGTSPEGTESINLYADGVLIPNLTIDLQQDGTWTVTLTVPTDIGPGLHEFTATAVNNGVESGLSNAVSFTISCAPTIDAHGDDTDCTDGITISGTSPEGTESINLYADGVLIPNLTIDLQQDGTWTVTLTVPTDIGPGLHEFTATAVNNGVESGLSNAVSFTISCAPTIDAHGDDTDCTDGITISGTSPEGTESINLYADGVLIPNLTIDLQQDGTWTVTLTVPTDIGPGLHEFTATAVNNGVESGLSNAVSFTISCAPTIDAHGDDTDRTDGITISGTSPEGTESINLYADGVLIPNLTIDLQQDGTWTVTLTVPTDIGPGLHEFTATAVNNGVESGLSNAVSFTISCAPTIDAHGDDTDCTDGITISGTSPEGTESINLYADGVLIPNLTIDLQQDGTWTVTLTVPTDIGPGLHEFTATAVNNGVESGLSNAVSFTISCAPTIDAHGDDTDCSDGITISGTSPEGTESINLYADGVLIPNLTIDLQQDGTWTVTLTVPTDIGPGLHEFTATAVNNGVESGLSNAVSFTISCAPTIDAHGDDTDCSDGITISGTSPEGTESINLYADGVLIPNLTIDLQQDGTWTVTLTVPTDIGPGLHEFTATAVNNGVESGLSNAVSFTISCAPTIDAHGDDTDW